MSREVDGGLSHLDDEGRARMVDVGGKEPSERTARAACRVVCSPETAALVAEGTLPKGDVIAVARIAGIQAAKRTAELIPLCHQIALSSVDVEISVDADAGEIRIIGSATATDRTGVEMEALTAASVAALTVYDMIKGVERGASITDLRLLEKTGGQRGDWSAGIS
jgi:cyclic pyranopterin monophosphate synthase